MPTAKKPTKSKAKSVAATSTNLAKVTKPTSLTATQGQGKSTAITIKSKKATALAPVKVAKTDLVAQYQSHKSDTGSTAVQIALLSQQISELGKHLKQHTKDHDSRRGLLIMVGKRRKLLNYLGRTDTPGYQRLIADLKLRK